MNLYAESSSIVGWLVAKLHGVKTCFRVLMTHDRWVTFHLTKEALKHFLFKRIDRVETPGNDGERFAMRYGVPAECIYLATHTVDIEHYQSVSLRARAKREMLRQESGVVGTVFIYVGRLWWGKGVSYLLEAFERRQRSSSEEVNCSWWAMVRRTKNSASYVSSATFVS